MNTFIYEPKTLELNCTSKWKQGEHATVDAEGDEQEEDDIEPAIKPNAQNHLLQT